MAKDIPSVVGRLLRELSWEGRKITAYHGGGRGFENVLTAEVFQALDFLPRPQFMGNVARALEGGSEDSKQLLTRWAEQLLFSVLPGAQFLRVDGGSRIEVQPDAILKAPGLLAIVEAKRIRPSWFQPDQIARELLLLHQDAEASGDKPLLILVLPKPPPIPIRGGGSVSVREALSRGLSRTLPNSREVESWLTRGEASISWITWSRIAQIVSAEVESLSGIPEPLRASIQRVAASVTAAIEWHA